MSPLHVVAAVLTDPDGRVFAARRRPERSSGGLWEFPGGKVEPGESARAALEREILEELDCVVIAGETLDRSSTVAGALTIDLECIRAHLTGTAPTHSSDHDLLGWFTPTELAALEWCTPDLPAVRVLLR